MNVINSTISGNEATVTGSNSYDFNCYAKGGGIYSPGTLEIQDSTISGNTASSIPSNAGYNKAEGGGLFSNGKNVNIYNSEIFGNTANSSNDLGSCISKGGGIFATHDSYTLKLYSSTIAENTADADSYAFGGGIFTSTNSIISNCTISKNSVSGGAEIGAGVYLNLGSAVIRNTIIANNTDNANDYDYYWANGTLADGGYNVVKYQNLAATAANNGTAFNDNTDILYNTVVADPTIINDNWNQNGGDPPPTPNLNLSSTLAENGGPTLTLAFLDGSFAAASETTGIPSTSNWNGSPLIDGCLYRPAGCGAHARPRTPASERIRRIMRQPAFGSAADPPLGRMERTGAPGPFPLRIRT